MSETRLDLTPRVAGAVLLDVAQAQGGYNKGWSWWAYDASEHTSYGYGFGTCKKEQFVDNTDALELILSVSPDDSDDTFFYRVIGSSSSYSGESWTDSIQRVQPTERVIRIYE
jgi:hypothetical protein